MSLELTHNSRRKREMARCQMVVQMKRECRDRAESKEQMDSVHSCLAGSSAWQAGYGLARGEDRGEPLNVHSLQL